MSLTRLFSSLASWIHWPADVRGVSGCEEMMDNHLGRRALSTAEIGEIFGANFFGEILLPKCSGLIFFAKFSVNFFSLTSNYVEHGDDDQQR